ncbi:cob(I)yrinic acid a,c-diamide adenosyltransferase [Iodidimonas nitroreducens]|uniref:Corrinoid adenosyltransferase n=1 Tax=Iodidimonas nitroreducens TaxID=1236968 RepID=A0A5A7NCM2_9PROT|nr:cob(I)yrinic acid a,c-diamide adenosyltransferase [Iodidimonas nitroreducens]GAK34010.1 cob(I)yrinic acid a,c-diamide adenosyltransferase [alpha proteobacterium Q-1]GER05474.1 cob(I)yrinic acid a,c-diamide adenosyltransferase [Iodidimonas nitroreducens]
MVKLTKIYTRGGDQGETSLVDGSRVPKYAPRIEAFGSIDEANAVLGIVRLHSSGIIDEMLARIQNELFDLGADLATPPLEDAHEAGALRITDDQVTRLEREIDAMNERLSPLSSFILPGGSPVAAHLHLARTIVRRAERLMVLAGQDTEINAAARKYANRLSDHLFVLSRIANENGAQDVLWKPGATRQKG